MKSAALRRLAIVGIAAMAGAFVPAAASGALPGPDYVGANAQPLVKLGFVGPADWGRFFDAASAGGVRVIRADAGWAFAEPTAPVGGVHSYTWNRPAEPTRSLDLLVATLAQRNIRWLPVISTAPGWSGGAGTWVTPARYPDLAAFSAALVARYGANGSFWAERPDLPRIPPRDYELWTEANSSNMWTGRADAAAYMAGFAPVSQAMKAVDPSVRVFASIGWQNFESFVSELYARGARGLIDGIAFHPYAPHAQAMIDLTVRLRARLRGLGDPNLPIDITEAGQPIARTGDGAASAGSGLVTDAARAATQSLTADALARSDCGVGAFVVYSLMGSETNAEPGAEGFMGILSVSDARPNLTGAALFDVATRWRANPRGGLALCSEAETEPRNLLPLTMSLERSGSMCVRGVVRYGGNQLESAQLTLQTADGREVKAESNAYGRAQVCAPEGTTGSLFDVRAVVPDVAATATVRCLAAADDCRPVAAVTERPPDLPKDLPGAVCQWRLDARMTRKTARTVSVRTRLRCAPMIQSGRLQVRIVRTNGTSIPATKAQIAVPEAARRSASLVRPLRRGERLLVSSSGVRGDVPAMRVLVGQRGAAGVTATGEEACRWRLEARVLRARTKRAKVRVSLACVPPGAETLVFTLERERGARRLALKRVSLATGREQDMTVRTALRRGDRLRLRREADVERGVPALSAVAR